MFIAKNVFPIRGVERYLMSTLQSIKDEILHVNVGGSMVSMFNSIRDWNGFSLEPAASDTSNVFGLAQFLSSLALLVVVFNVSDFRYRYRLYVTRYNLSKVAIYTASMVAGALLLTEVWFQNALPIPHCLNHYANIKIALAGIFLILVIYIVSICFLRPAQFGRANALQFFNATARFIHQGNKDRLQAIAEDLSGTMEEIFRLSSQINPTNGSPTPPTEAAPAHYLLLALADRRFCKLIVERDPAFAVRCFVLAAKYPEAPFAQFSRNVGEEFILNTDSAFYQEESGFSSGYFGYAKPVTSAVFGSYELIEHCAVRGLSALDLNFSILDTLDATQMGGFKRAGLAFFASYLEKGASEIHSYAFARLLRSMESCSNGIYKINGLPAGAWKSPDTHDLATSPIFSKEQLLCLIRADLGRCH